MRWKYCGNFIHEKATQTATPELKFFSTAEGYVEPEYASGAIIDWNYIYQCKDHLGNIRLSYGDDNEDGIASTSEIREENNYYPFGLKHKGYNNLTNGRNHKYGFGGKEEQDEVGLGWVDITARNYEPSIGRWMNLDPLAEAMRRHSPYNYAFDNPIYFIDPDGMMAVGANECPSCNTEQDWIDYREQIDNMGQSMGFSGAEDMALNFKSLSTSRDESGHLILSRDGKPVDISRNENRISAFGDFFAPLIEGAPKAIMKFFKGKSTTQTVKAADEAGTATILKYEGTAENPFGHYAVETNVNGNKVMTDQIVTSKDLSTTTVRTRTTGDAISTAEVKLPNAKAAQNYQKAQVGKQLGPYNKRCNSCVNHVGNVLRNGGVNISNSPLREFSFIKTLFDNAH